MDKLFAIIDIETTGGRAIRDKITEIAIVLHNGTEVVDEYETLVNPEAPIPYGITELTGITNEMVADAPKFYEVAKKVVEMTEGAIFVAHNVRFDYSFIQAEFKRLGFAYTRKKLCTVRLARRAFPGLPSYSLGRLIPALGLNAGARHRAMGDTMATVDLFERIMAKEQAADNIDYMVNLGVKEAFLPKNFTMEKLHSLPEECGVYYFHDPKGDVVYVGKSLNIKKRVAEHFAVRTEKARKLQSVVHDVSFELTGSEVVALLLESHEIKRLRPLINRAQKIRQFPYVIHSFENEEGYLSLEVKKVTAKVRKSLKIVASYPKLSIAKSWMRRAQQEFILCSKHCHLEPTGGACFEFHLNRCLGACIGRESPEEYNIRVNSALDLLNEHFINPNFFLIDRGRSDEENAVVMVENGKYRGFGFADLSDINGNLEELQGVIKNYENNPEVMRILQRFVAKPTGFKIIPF